MGRVQAQKLSAATGINLAAVDFVFHFPHPNPRPLLLEINYYFGRRGLGGSLKYYRLLHRAIQAWLLEKGFDPKSVTYV
jgi:ribosomal protein S6--L-glutamate ligase